MSGDRLETMLAVVRGEMSAEQAADELGVEVSEVQRDARRIRDAAKPPARGQARGRPKGRLALWMGAALLGVALLGGIGFGVWRWLPSGRSAEAQACDHGIIERLRGLEEPMTITLYLSPATPKVQLAGDALTKLLARYADASGGKMEFVRVDVKTEEQTQQAKESGLQEVAFGESGDSEVVSLARGYYGLVFAYGAEKEVIPVLSPERSGGVEFWIANRIKDVVARQDGEFSTIGVSVSEGGVNVGDPHLVAAQAGRAGPSITTVLTQAMPFYKLTDTPLSEAIADDVDVLVVTQPGAEGIGDEARRHVDDFLMRGNKAVVVLGGAANVPPHDASMQATLDLRGLDALAAPYGVEIQRALVLSASSMKLPVQETGGATRHLALPSLLEVAHDESATAETQTLDNDFAGFFRIEEIAVPFASPLVAHPDRQPGATVRVVARSTAEASLVDAKSVSVSPTDHVQPSGAQQQVNLAIAVEGTLKSAFGDRQAPGRLLVVGSAQFLANPFARAGNPSGGEFVGGDPTLQALATPYAQRYLTATILVFKNIVDWASADEALLACSALLLTPNDEEP